MDSKIRVNRCTAIERDERRETERFQLTVLATAQLIHEDSSQRVKRRVKRAAHSSAGERRGNGSASDGCVTNRDGLESTTLFPTTLHKRRCVSYKHWRQMEQKIAATKLTGEWRALVLSCWRSPARGNHAACQSSLEQCCPR